jgi:hypothetical protein
MDEDRFYLQLYLYNKLSSLRPSDMSDPSMRYVQDTRFSYIRRDPEYAFTSLFIFSLPHPQSMVTQTTPRRSPSSCQLARSVRGTLPIIG